MKRPNFLMIISIKNKDRNITIPLPLFIITLIIYPVFLGGYIFFLVFPQTWKNLSGKIIDDDITFEFQPRMLIQVLKLYRSLRWSGSFDLVDINDSSGDGVSIRLR